ncbi:MAG: hypothetical protein ACR2I2_07990 [Bryobacteraceae bacterium]
MQLLWKYQTGPAPNNVNRYSTMMDPLVVENAPTRDGPRKIVFLATAENNVYVIDAEKGTLIWTRSYPNTAKPPVVDKRELPEQPECHAGRRQAERHALFPPD